MTKNEIARRNSPLSNAEKLAALHVDVDDTLRFGAMLIDREEATQHFLIAAGTGGGKTTLIRLMLEDILRSIKPGADTRALIFDPKHDMLPILKGIDPKQRVVTLNPFDARSAAWDIASDVTEARVAIEVAWTLIPEMAVDSQPFFPNAARHLLIGVMHSFMLRGLQWSFADLIRASSRKRRLKRILKACPETRDIAGLYLKGEKTVESIMSTLATKLLLYTPLAATWEAAEERVSLEQWANDEYVLVLGSSDTSREPIQAINRCLFKRVTDIVLNQSESRARRSWFVLDELSEAGKHESLMSLCKRGRSKGAAVLMAFQSIQGLKNPNLYGPNVTDEILGQVGHRIFGRLDCVETAEWASRVVGDQERSQITKQMSYTSAMQGSSWTATNSQQIVTQKTILPSEFMALPPCSEDDGLRAVYVSRIVDPFTATIPGHELFHLDLTPPDPNTPDFVPRDPRTQFLKPWTPEQEAIYAPQPPTKQKRSPESPMDWPFKEFDNS